MRAIIKQEREENGKINNIVVFDLLRGSFDSRLRSGKAAIKNRRGPRGVCSRWKIQDALRLPAATAVGLSERQSLYRIQWGREADAE